MGNKDRPEPPNPRSLSAYAECEDCGEEKPVMVAPDGHYCGECVPDDQLEYVVRAVHRGY